MNPSFAILKTQRSFHSEHEIIACFAPTAQNLSGANCHEIGMRSIGLTPSENLQKDSFRLEVQYPGCGSCWIEERAFAGAFLQHLYGCQASGRWRIEDPYKEVIVRTEVRGALIRSYVEVDRLENVEGEDVASICDLSAFGMNATYLDEKSMSFQFMNDLDTMMVIPLRKGALKQKVGIDVLRGMEELTSNEYFLLVDVYEKEICCFHFMGGTVKIDDRVRLCLNDFLKVNSHFRIDVGDFTHIDDRDASLSINILESDGHRWVVSDHAIVGTGLLAEKIRFNKQAY